MKLISIIIPVYNVEKYIRQCLDSVINQTYKNLQIIIVDDGSPDNCPAICDEYAKKDNRIVVIHQKNSGLCEARNSGIRIAKGDYIAFIDSDDWIELNTYERVLKFANKNKLDMTIYGRYWENGIQSTAKNNQNYLISDRLKIRNLCLSVFSQSYTIKKYNFSYNLIPTVWNVLFNADIIKNNNLLFNRNCKLSEDVLFNLYACYHSQIIGSFNEPFYHYRIISGSNTQSYKPNLKEIMNDLFIEFNEFIEKNYSDDFEFKKVFSYFVYTNLKWSMKLNFYNSNNPKSIKSRIKELRALLLTEPYKSSIADLEYKYTAGKNMGRISWFFLFLLKHKFIYTLFFIIWLSKKFKIAMFKEL